LQYVYC
ncbi:ubiA prenyltransferase family protein, partial [Chlamydia psittaci 06-1683]